ncbi:Uncharacterised protein [Neisseria gonorrhoeae]|uniref:Uncharacterized protein n=1 Tax=Neisseria gonorrhoeae TaxID=485 RepID=A0A378W0K5_NEIGO|nr:Uncharacterised protein [Neisseria gonorrhoeae]
MDDVYRAFDSVGNILNFRIVEKSKRVWVSTKSKQLYLIRQICLLMIFSEMLTVFI